MGIFIGVILLGLLYFLPTIAALNHKQLTAIFALNVLLGWTFIGWAIAFVWALTKNSK